MNQYHSVNSALLRAIPVSKRKSINAWHEKANSDAAGGVVANRATLHVGFGREPPHAPGYGPEQGKENALLANRTLCELP